MSATQGPPIQGTFLAPSGETNPAFEAWTNQISQTLNTVAGIASPKIRPLRANDLNTSYNDIFNGFTMSATANAASAWTSAGFTTATGKAYAIFGVQDLTAGTKSVTGLQVVVNGVNIPLQNIPLTHGWSDSNGEVYFSPIYALQPNQGLAVNVYGFTASATVSLRLIGYVVETGGNR